VAQRDYVSRGQSKAPRKKPNRKKSSSPRISKTVLALAAALVVVFVGGLYFITHNKQEEAAILPVHAPRPGNGLPPKPEERWRYIKELENRQTTVTTPTAPTSGGSTNTSKPQLTAEQRQLLDQMQADMQQRPTQLSEVPYNDGSVAPTRNAPAQQQPAYQQAPVNTPRNPFSSGNNNQQQTQTRPHTTQPAPVTQAKPETRMLSEPKAPVREARTESKPAETKPVHQPKPVESKPAESKPVETKTAEAKPTKEPEKEKSQRWLVQCGSFRGSDQAESVRAQLAFEGFESRVTAGGGWNRVVIGPYNSRSAADSTLQRLKGSGYSSCIPLAVGG